MAAVICSTQIEAEPKPTPMDAQQQLPTLIIGAGISGLTLAQACRKEDLPFRIFERDESATSRGAGWGLTLNWALPTFRALLPDDILERLPETYVNKAAVDAGEKGSFTFFDLSTGEAKWKTPASERIRVSRERLRKLLLTGLEVEWSRSVKEVVKDSNGVTARFSNDETATGSLLVACDGSHSTVRRLLHPEAHENYQIPVRLLGATVTYPESQMSDIRKLDPFFLQGSDPRTEAFLYFSYLDAPGDTGAPTNENGEKAYRCQIMISWPYREGFFGRADPTDVPNVPILQLSWMKSLAEEWAEPFHSIVKNIPNDVEIKPIELSDWVPRRNADIKFDGRVVLLGDAQHAMVMYRGEGANHSIVDVSVLLDRIRPLYSSAEGGALKDAVKSYEDEVVKRTGVAVLASRRACLDAHDHKRLDDRSPLVRRRAMKEDLAAVQHQK